MITTCLTELELNKMSQQIKTGPKPNEAEISIKVDQHKEDIRRIENLRDQYKRELHNMKDADRDVLLILQAKVIALGQALDEIGYHDYDKEIDR